MDKNKENEKLNDALLDQVAGGIGTQVMELPPELINYKGWNFNPDSRYEPEPQNERGD